MAELICEHCGDTAADEQDLEIFHRSCRLKAVFPGAYSQQGGLVTFDMDKVAEAVGYKKSLRTDRGISFQPDEYGVWVTIDVEVGGELSNWSWHLDWHTWHAVVKHVEEQSRNTLGAAERESR